MAVRLLSRAGGFVHDINTVASLSDEPNNIRLLSDRSLYILQNLSQEDVTFLSRYGQMLTGDLYLPVLSGSAEQSDVEDAINLIRRDLNSMGVEELLECLCAQLSALAEQAGLDGQGIDAPPSDGVIETGPGKQFGTQSEYFDAKCNAANGIYDTVLGLVDWLEDNNVDLLAGAFGGVTSGLALALIVVGPVGWAIEVVAVGLAGLASFLIAFAVGFDDLKNALIDAHDECVLSLFNASNANTAESGFVAAIAASSEPTTIIERNLVGLMLTDEMLNQLFAPREDVVLYISPDPVDCGGAILQIWDFDADFESWTFTDDSDPGSSATRSYDTPLQAIENELIVQSAPNVSAIGRNTSPDVALSIVPGSSIQADFGPTSDGFNVQIIVRAIYDDATEEESGLVFSSAGTHILSLTQTKTLETVEVEFGRSTSGSSQGTTNDVDLLEVRVVGL